MRGSGKVRRVNEAKAALSIVGFETTPDVITEQVRVAPTEVVYKGVDGKGRNRAWLENSWWLDSRLPRSSSLNDHIDDVLAQLEPQWNAFVSLCNKYEAFISCEVCAYEYIPEMTIDKKTVRRIAVLNASIDIDYYHDLRDEGTEEGA